MGGNEFRYCFLPCLNPSFVLLLAKQHIVAATNIVNLVNKDPHIIMLIHALQE